MILDVPFISWDDGRIPTRMEMNRSDPASHGMVWEYWGRNLADIFNDTGPSDKEINEWITGEKQGASINDLKPFIKRNIPVVVAPTALTPFAHPADDMPVILGFGDDEQNLTSGALSGMFVTLKRFGPGFDLAGRVYQDLYWSARVVVGYDDSQSIIILHDPTFGPYWEVGYEDFDKMWEIGGRKYFATYPPNYADILATRSRDIHREPRAPNHEASVQFVFGYALSAIGRKEQAEALLRQGLAIEGIGVGYRYLLLLELAVVRFSIGDIDEAMGLAKEASTLLPHHHASWNLLANLVRSKSRGSDGILATVSGAFNSRLTLMKAKAKKAGGAGSASLPTNLYYHESFL